MNRQVLEATFLCNPFNVRLLRFGVAHCCMLVNFVLNMMVVPAQISEFGNFCSDRGIDARVCDSQQRVNRQTDGGGQADGQSDSATDRESKPMIYWLSRQITNLTQVQGQTRPAATHVEQAHTILNARLLNVGGEHSFLRGIQVIQGSPYPSETTHMVWKPKDETHEMRQDAGLNKRIPSGNKQQLYFMRFPKQSFRNAVGTL